MTDWRKMSMEERRALPLGHEGWAWTPGEELPKGVWVERKAEPVHLPNGAIITAVKRCSSGVGQPSMDLLGSTKGVDPAKIVHGDGWYPMAPGSYKPFKPAAGDKGFDGDKPYKGRGK
jgi:hypothetical protein